MKRVICMSPGYVESHKVWKTFFVSNTIFKSEEAALDSLARDLWDVYDDDNNNKYWRKCCRTSLEVESNVYCPQCGTRLKEPDPDVAQLAAFVVEILSCDANELPDVMSNWWPWHEMSVLLEIPKEQWIFLEDNWAETKMAERMLELKKAEDEDCLG